MALTWMTSPMILVVRMRRDTEGPNKLPGRSRLTLFRSNTGMSVAAWRRRRLERVRSERRHHDGLPLASRAPRASRAAPARRLHVDPLCGQAALSMVAARRASPALTSLLVVCCEIRNVSPPCHHYVSHTYWQNINSRTFDMMWS